MCPPLAAITKTPSTHLEDIPNCLPLDHVSQGTYKLAQQCLPPSILNHSLRVFLIAELLAHREQSEWATLAKKSLLCVACVLHDIGCTAQFDGPQRFEIEGADAAATYLRQHTTRVSDSDIHDVWQAIALHTSPGIAERISPLARLVRQAVLIDFGVQGLVDKAGQDDIRGTAERAFPRIDVERVLGDVVVDQALRQPGKAPPASWPGILLRAKTESPEWDGVNKAF